MNFQIIRDQKFSVSLSPQDEGECMHGLHSSTTALFGRREVPLKRWKPTPGLPYSFLRDLLITASVGMRGRELHRDLMTTTSWQRFSVP